MKIQHKTNKKPAIILTYMMTAIAATVIFSCNKYLDVKQDSAEALVSTASDGQLLLDNYSAMNTGYSSDGEASADNYYLTDKSYNALSAEDRNIYIWLPTAQRATAAPQWQNPYKVVYQANIVIEAMAKLPAATDVNTVKGSALFFRSFAFYQVAQLYCKPYTATAAQDPGIPLRLSSDVNAKSVRGTVAQTYQQIINDLQTAVSLLPQTSSISSRPNKAAAYALLARTYLAMADYTNAGKAAAQALELQGALIDYNTLNPASGTPFIRFNKEVIFQAIMIGTAYSFPNGVFTQNDATMDPSVAKIDPVLYASYADNDLRQRIFFKGNTGTDTLTYSFKGNYDGTPGNAFFDGLATDEMYLTRAECSARAGDATSAMADLNTLLKTRYATGTFTNITASSADDVLIKVLTERRKELIFRGLRWTDLRRLNSDNRFQVTLKRTIGGQVYTLPPNDLRYVQLLPVDVIANSSLPQNPR